jgi:biopolymer transport protein TolR
MGMSVSGGPNGSKSSGSMSEPNVVPLIDVLLVLIIIFMVITPVTPQGLTAEIPQPDRSSVDTSSPIVVQVESGGTVWINHDQTDWDHLGSRLGAIYKQRAEKVAFVRGDDGVDFSQVARAIDIMRGAGIDTVGLMPHSL